MNARELRHKYLSFFESKGHLIFPSGSLIPYDVTGRLDESLLFNGAGMVQFKPYFRGTAEPKNKLLVNSQKCVRTVDIELVGDSSHLTFFEMLGNFSFGDYFKESAIKYAWEFLTDQKWLALDPKRLCSTIFTEDTEAKKIWDCVWKEVDFDPRDKVFLLGEKTNYWPAGAFSSGPPGPCGPNSEIFYWISEEDIPKDNYTVEDFLRDESSGKWLEIWNLVFIQYEWKGDLKNPSAPSEGYEKTGMPLLPFQSIDTGMGLERTAAVLNGSGSVYDTDVFAPIFRKIEECCLEGIKYGSDFKKDAVFRVIADHARMASFCIADGIFPGNTGRGYVLRRLIRRAVLKGKRSLGLDCPFFSEVFEGVLFALGDHFHELREHRELIAQTLHQEELLFRNTLTSGAILLGEELSSLKKGDILSGASAFKLYDTYGFPLEVTVELCQEGGIEVDHEEYDQALKKAQALSRSSGNMETVYGGVSSGSMLLSEGAPSKTDFVGYTDLSIDALVVGVCPILDKTDRSLLQFEITLDQTSFYAESGGQVSDRGYIQLEDLHLKVLSIQKRAERIWHCVLPESPKSQLLELEGLDKISSIEYLAKALLQKSVTCCVDITDRKRTESHHTATHLLHASLRKVLGTHVTQAGSLVSPEYLRFDFTHSRAMHEDELLAVEKLVNEKILENLPVQIYANISLEEARKKGAMALFGEKYGEFVRMVQIGDFSLELCGGTHLLSTGQMGFFKIIHESSAASGIRRIEAKSGFMAYEWLQLQLDEIKQSSRLLKCSPSGLVESIQRLLDHQKALNHKIEKLLISKHSSKEIELSKFGEIELAFQSLKEGDLKEATQLVDHLVSSGPFRVGFVVLEQPEKLMFVCKVGSRAQSLGVHAGHLVGEAAKLSGGGGGGRPDFATAGSKNVSESSKIVELLRNRLNAYLAAVSS